MLCLACQPQVHTFESEEVAPGVSHHEIFLLQGPWAIHVLEIDLPRAWKAGIRLHLGRPEKSGFARTSTLAEGALAAINGDFVIGQGHVWPAGIEVHEGRVISPPRRRSAFAMTAEGRPMIAIFRFRAGVISAAGRTWPIEVLNPRRSVPGLKLYNHYAGAERDSIYDGIGFRLQRLDSSPSLDDTVQVLVSQVRRRAWPLQLDSKQWLVAADEGHLLGSQVTPGDTLKLFVHLPPAEHALEEAIGGGPRILRDGVVSIEYQEESLDRDFALARHPRTAIGYSRDRNILFLVTVDGRQPGSSVGMTLEELAQFMGRELANFSGAQVNAHQALNMDGGGQTTMVVRRQVVNKPSDPPGEGLVANALLVLAAKNPKN